MTSDSLIIALLAAAALLLVIGWIAVITGVLLTVRRVHAVLRVIEATAESVRSTAIRHLAKRALRQAARTFKGI